MSHATASRPVGTRVAGRPAPLPWWGAALLIFAASRVVSTALFLWVGTQATLQSRAGLDPSFTDLTTAWDGQWYWLIGVEGYPAELPLTDAGDVETNQWAFLPVYPLLVRLLTFGVLPWPAVALVVSVLSGFGAAVLLALLLMPHIGRPKALFAVAAFACSPLAFVLQMAYAEALGLLLLFAALCLVDRHRYLAAIPVAVALAFTRPGVVALALAIGLHGVVRIVRSRRGLEPLSLRELASGTALTVIAAGAGFAWIAIAALATGRGDAYFATESAWRRLWMDESAIRFFEPWLFAADHWATLAVGAEAAAWVAPIAVVAIVIAFAALLIAPPVRRLGTTVRLWLAAYAFYLLAVFFPQSSVFRLLMPMAPIAGALTPVSIPARAALLIGSLTLQGLWLWVVLGPLQTYWSVP